MHLCPRDPLEVQLQAYGGDALLQDMERLFSDGTWTEAEVAKACDTWKAPTAARLSQVARAPLLIPILLFPCVNCTEHVFRFLMSWEARQQDAHRVTLKKLADSVEVGVNVSIGMHRSPVICILVPFFAQVVVDKNLSDLGESDQLDFKRLRPQIEEAWRSAERGRGEAAIIWPDLTLEQRRPGGRQDKVNSKLEKRAKAQVP